MVVSSAVERVCFAAGDVYRGTLFYGDNIMRLCNDVDICKWEPMLYSSAAGAERCVCAGNGGVVSGTQFSVNDNDFLLCGVEPGFILRCWNELAMVDFCCEIVAVQEDGGLAVSTVRPGDIESLWSPGNYTNLNYAVVSYSPVVEELSYSILSKLQLVDGVESLVDKRPLRLVCVFAVIAAIYMALAQKEEDELYRQKSEYYSKRFMAEYNSFIADVDEDGDGEADRVVNGNTILLKRK